MQKTRRIYSDSKRVVQEDYYDADRPAARTVFKYDGNNNLIEAAFFMADGSPAYAPVGPCLGAHRMTFTYDDKGRVLTKEIFESDGTLKKSWKYAYDEHNNPHTIVVNNISSTTTFTYAYVYDQHGNWVKQSAVNDTQDGLLDLMLKATGKSATPAEIKKMNDETKTTSVTTREIIYY